MLAYLGRHFGTRHVYDTASICTILHTICDLTIQSCNDELTTTRLCVWHLVLLFHKHVCLAFTEYIHTYIHTQYSVYIPQHFTIENSTRYRASRSRLWDPRILTLTRSMKRTIYGAERNEPNSFYYRGTNKSLSKSPWRP